MNCEARPWKAGSKANQREVAGSNPAKLAVKFYHTVSPVHENELRSAAFSLGRQILRQTAAYSQRLSFVVIFEHRHPRVVTSTIYEVCFLTVASWHNIIYVTASTFHVLKSRRTSGRGGATSDHPPGIYRRFRHHHHQVR